MGLLPPIILGALLIVAFALSAQQRLAIAQQSVDLRKTDGAATVQAFVLSGTGKAQMDHLRKVADNMEAEERRLLAIRTASA